MTFWTAVELGLGWTWIKWQLHKWQRNRITKL